MPKNWAGNSSLLGTRCAVSGRRLQIPTAEIMRSETNALVTVEPWRLIRNVLTRSMSRIPMPAMCRQASYSRMSTAYRSTATATTLHPICTNGYVTRRMVGREWMAWMLKSEPMRGLPVVAATSKGRPSDVGEAQPYVSWADSGAAQDRIGRDRARPSRTHRRRRNGACGSCECLVWKPRANQRRLVARRTCGGCARAGMGRRAFTSSRR